MMTQLDVLALILLPPPPLKASLRLCFLIPQQILDLVKSRLQKGNNTKYRYLVKRLRKGQTKEEDSGQKNLQLVRPNNIQTTRNKSNK
jgi:hypothetical protein